MTPAADGTPAGAIRVVDVVVGVGVRAGDDLEPEFGEAAEGAAHGAHLAVAGLLFLLGLPDESGGGLEAVGGEAEGFLHLAEFPHRVLQRGLGFAFGFGSGLGFSLGQGCP